MPDFQTLGPKSTNSYLLVFVKGLGTVFIDQWVGKHDVNLFSVVQLSCIAAVKMIGEEADDDDEDAVINMARDLYPIMLKRLEGLGKIDREKREELQNAYTGGQDLVNAFLPLALELAEEKDEEEDSDSDGEGSSKKEKKKKLSKLEKKALKLEKAMKKKASKTDKKNAKLQAKMQKLSASLSGEGDDENRDVEVEGEVEVDANGEANGNDMSSLATSLGLDPASPVMAAVLAAMAKNQTDQNGAGQA